MSTDDAATVLVVDDSATKRYLLVSWLTRAGFTVVEAETGARGAATGSPGARRRPGRARRASCRDMSGFEVCERIKTDPRLRRHCRSSTSRRTRSTSSTGPRA